MILILIHPNPSKSIKVTIHSHKMKHVFTHSTLSKYSLTLSCMGDGGLFSCVVRCILKDIPQFLRIFSIIHSPPHNIPFFPRIPTLPFPPIFHYIILIPLPSHHLKILHLEYSHTIFHSSHTSRYYDCRRIHSPPTHY